MFVDTFEKTPVLIACYFHVSKSFEFGDVVGLPRCHFPAIPVTYPRRVNASAIVCSRLGKPPDDTIEKTRDVPKIPDLIGYRP